ncbi:MAG: glycosyltransferase family 4 protein [Methylohalobius sp. ZOD2]
MKILIIHNNFPGQFNHLAKSLSRYPGNQVVAICQDHAPGLKDAAFTQLAKAIYSPKRKPNPRIHHYLYNVESSVLNGQAVAKLLHELKCAGFTPDLCIGHIGWGEMLYVKDIFPDTPSIGYCEFYYHAFGGDADFNPVKPITPDDHLRIRTKNAVTLLSLVACDAGVSPTHWQRQLYPEEFQSKIRVIHEGIDTATIRPGSGATLTLPNGNVLDSSMEVVTYIARSLEPYRGFHIFMRAAEEICRRRPNTQIVILGEDDVSYGARLPNHETYRSKLLREVTIDPDRVHFLGTLSYDAYQTLLQVSSIHVYLTVPFVLSWSLLEAMASECVIVGSATPPVEEVIRHNENGLLVDFFSPRKIADHVDEIFAHPKRMAHLAQQARQDVVDSYPVQQSLSQYRRLFDELTQSSRGRRL